MAMAATTDQQARMFSLLIGVGELVRDGKRDAEDVLRVLQVIKEERKFAEILLVKHGEASAASPPARRWREEEDMIRFTVTSDGITGSAWIERLEKEGFRLSKYAKDVLRSSDFRPTSGVTTEIAVLKGMLFTDDDRVTQKVRVEADKRKLEMPNPEVACLIREMFTDEDLEAMGLWWLVIMHEPINDSGGDPSLLGAGRGSCGRWLDADDGSPGGEWDRDGGFAFGVPQVSSQN